jgi:hypothetical protein
MTAGMSTAVTLAIDRTRSRCAATWMYFTKPRLWSALRAGVGHFPAKVKLRRTVGFGSHFFGFGR